MLDTNAPPANRTLQDTLDRIAAYLFDAFRDGTKLPLTTTEIVEEYVPGLTFDLAVSLGWISKPTRPETGGTYLGDHVVTEEYYEEFRKFLPTFWELGQHVKEHGVPEELNKWEEPTPDKLFQKFKEYAGLTEVEIAEKVGCSEKTFQRLKVPGYRTKLSILTELADFMKKERPIEFGEVDCLQLMWRKREE
jgi:hypothetical protein